MQHLCVLFDDFLPSPPLFLPWLCAHKSQVGTSIFFTYQRLFRFIIYESKTRKMPFMNPCLKTMYHLVSFFPSQSGRALKYPYDGDCSAVRLHFICSLWIKAYKVDETLTVGYTLSQFAHGTAEGMASRVWNVCFDCRLNDLHCIFELSCHVGVWITVCVCVLVC